MQPFFTIRSPFIQAQLWCQSRSAPTIAAEASKLRAAGAPWLASLLQAPPKAGPLLTNALPGQSWHQWGEAVDCYVTGSQNEAIWDAKHPGYRVYAEEAVKLGLDAGANWKTMKDTVHVQLRQQASPSSAGMSWAEIEAAMIKRFRED